MMHGQGPGYSSQPMYCSPYNQTSMPSRSGMAKVIMRLIEPNALDLLLSMKPLDMFMKMERQELRSMRPVVVETIHRPFSVDLEGDLLDAWDSSQSENEKSVFDIQPENVRISTIYSLCLWSCVAEWTCWDARAYLYFEPYVSTEMDVHDILDHDFWRDFATEVSRFSRAEYIDSVTQDWIARRDALGAPSESSQDPYLMSTMSAHRSSSSDLFSISEIIRRDGDHMILLGIDQTPLHEWNLNGVPLSKFKR